MARYNQGINFNLPSNESSRESLEKLRRNVIGLVLIFCVSLSTGPISIISRVVFGGWGISISPFAYVKVEERSGAGVAYIDPIVPFFKDDMIRESLTADLIQRYGLVVPPEIRIQNQQFISDGGIAK